jgi:hypothetical protein
MLVLFRALILALAASATIAAPALFEGLDTRVSKCTSADADKRKPCKTDCVLTIETLMEVEVCQTGTCVLEYRGPGRVSDVEKAGWRLDGWMVLGRERKLNEC